MVVGVGERGWGVAWAAIVLCMSKWTDGHRCGALKHQPTQTCADNQDKHTAKDLCASMQK